MRQKLLLFLVFAFISTTLMFAHESDTVWNINISHADEIVKFSPDGQFIITAGNAGVYNFIETLSGKIIRQFVAYDGYLHGVFAISPDGSLLATNGDNIKCIIWDIASGNKIEVLKDSVTIKNSGYRHINSLAFSNDGKYLLAVISRYSDALILKSGIFIWDVETWELVKVIEEDDCKWQITYSPTGEYFATGQFAYPWRIQLWNGGTWEFEKVLGSHGGSDAGGISNIGFSNNGTMLFSSNVIGHSKLWDIQNMKVINEWSSKTVMCFTPDSKYLIARQAGTDHSIIGVLNIFTNEIVHSYDIYPVQDVDVSTDNKYIIVTTGANVTLLNLRSDPNTVSETYDSEVSDINFPNPFDSNTTIQFELPHAGFTIVSIYDEIGNLIETLLEEDLEKGGHSIIWNANKVSNGVYICNIICGSFNTSIKLLVENGEGN